MVNSEWCYAPSGQNPEPSERLKRYSPFTIHHSLFTSLLVVLPRARREGAALVAFAELAGRAAAADGALVGAVAGAAVARGHALDLAVGRGEAVAAGGGGGGAPAQRPHRLQPR